jgi:hypothetical protein
MSQEKYDPVVEKVLAGAIKTLDDLRSRYEDESTMDRYSTIREMKDLLTATLISAWDANRSKS